MIHDISVKISDTLCGVNHVTDTEKKEVITYGMEAIIATLSSILSVIILSLILGYTKECFAFLAAFMLLRTYTGGYHAPTHFKCMLLLIISFLFEILLLNLNMSHVKSIVLSCFMIITSTLTALKFTPIVDVNHPMSKRQIKNSKHIVKIILFFLIIAAITLTILHQYNLLLSMSYGMFVTAISVLSVVTANIKKGKE